MRELGVRTLVLEGDLTDWIIRMVAEQSGIPRAQISQDSRLYHDLKIWGDDAGELLTEFRDVFQVDFTGFAFEDYFPPEASWSKWPREFQPLTVRELVESARARRWIGAPK